MALHARGVPNDTNLLLGVRETKPQRKVHARRPPMAFETVLPSVRYGTVLGGAHKLREGR